MPEQGIRSTYSQCPFRIDVYGGADVTQPLSTATAFYYCYAGEWFLITNWHVVTGRHFLTRKLLDKQGREPSEIKVNLQTWHDVYPAVPAGEPQQEKFKAFWPAEYNTKLYEDNEPQWFEHPTYGHLCDVAALPFPRPLDCPEFMHNAANLISKTKIPVEPGSTVFIIGFPHGISTGPGLPLHKSGYIASEPYYQITVDGTILPAFLLDSQTRQGMSGSPVFAQYFGKWDLTDPYRKVDPNEPGFWERNDVALGEVARQFIGCYSGRLQPNQDHGEDAALGLCWPEDVIREICAAQKPGARLAGGCTVHPSGMLCQV